MKYSAFFLFCVIFFAACKKDKDGFYCESIPQSDFGWNYISDPVDSNYISLAGINPSNGTELLFAIRGANGKSKLCKYNLLSKTSSLVAEDNFTYAPSWGKNGWILYGLVNGTIWKIKDNGDSLSQMPGIYSAFHPCWNFLETGFTVFRSDLPINKHTVLYDFVTGGTLDTFYNANLTDAPFWLNDSILYYSLNDHIYRYNVHVKGEQTMYAFPANSNSFIGNVVSINEKLVYTAVGSNEWGGVYSFNENTGVNKRIIPVCTATQYGFVRYSPQLDKVFMTVAKYYDANFDQNTIKVKRYIVMVNPDGTNEQKVSMPIP